MRRIKEACIIAALSLVLLFLLEGGVRLSGVEYHDMQLETGRSLAMRDSLLGHRNQPSTVVREQGPEFSATYATDSRGLRVFPADIQTTHAARSDTFRLLLIGDSFTFGIGNDYEATWAQVFEHTLRARGVAVEVFNAGVPGYDTRTEALYLEHLLPRIQPDLVVLTFLPNDLFTNRPVGDTTAVQTVVGGDEKKQTLHVLSLLRRLIVQNDWLYTQLYRHTARAPFFETVPTKPVEVQFVTTEGLLERIQSVCQEEGVALMVLSLPQQFQVLLTAGGYAFDGIDVRGIDERLADRAHRGGYPWVSALDTLATAYAREGQDMYYRLDGHLTPAGNRVVGRFLANQFQHIVFDENETLSVTSNR